MKKILLMAGAMALASITAMAQGSSFEGTNLYGYTASGTAGFYDILPDGPVIRWEDTGYQSRFYVPMTSGWLNDGKMCGYATFLGGTSAYDNFYVEYDWATGEILQSKELSGGNAFRTAVLNTSDRYIYGYGVNGSTTTFMKASVDNPTSIEVIREVSSSEICYGLTYNSVDNYVAGILNTGALVKITPDGVQTPLMMTGVACNVDSKKSPLAYSAATGLYYWNPMLKSWDNAFFIIDAENQNIEQVSTFPDKQMQFMLAEGGVVADVPVEPEILSLEFPMGSADGKATVKLPAELNSGTPIKTPLHWEAQVDNVTAGEGDAAAGAEVTVTYTGLSTGSHSFTFTTTLDGEKGATASRTIYVGHDTPLKPEGVTLTATRVSWEAVTEGVHGGYVDAGAMTYTVAINGEVIATTEATYCDVPASDDTTMRLLTATVTATATGLSSEAAASNSIVAGDALQMPVFIAPTADDFGLCAHYDGNEDGRGWTFDATEAAFNSGYNDNTPLDDWLFLPPVQIDEPGTYYFSMQAKRRRNYFNQEYMEVRFGAEATPGAMADGVIVKEFVPGTEYEVYTGSLNVTAAGKYYVALHAMSGKDQAGILVKDITVSDNGVRADSPAAVTSLRAEAGVDGALQAKVSFKMPLTTVGGTDLDASAVIAATVKGAENVTVTGAPGEAVSTTVPTVQGWNKIAVETSLDGANGLVATVEVYCGVEVPAPVSNVQRTISEDMMSATFTWDAPEEGYDGGYISVDDLKYNVYVLTETMLGDVWELLAENVETRSYTFTATELMQDAYDVGICAVNAAGVCPETVSNLAVLGKPHTLPMIETFDIAGIYTYQPWVIYVPSDDYNTQWGVLPMSVLPFMDSAPAGNALCGMGLSNGCLGRSGFPVFSTKGCTNSVRFSAPFWLGESSTPDLKVTGITHGMTEPVEVGVVPAQGEDWQKVEFVLPESLMNREWVQLYLEASFPEGSAQWVVMDGYTISETSGINAAVTPGVKVRAIAGGIEISAPKGLPYAIYANSGATIATGTTSDDVNAVALQPGIYLVKVANNTVKVIVR